MLEIVRRQLERNWTFLLVVSGALAAFEFVICAVVANMDIQATLGPLTQFAPPLLRAMIEQNFAGGSPAAVLAFGWNHPVVHALLAAVAITLATRAIAGEVESGVIELVLAQPLSRSAYFAAHLLFAVVALSVTLGAGLLGTIVGQRYYSLDAFPLARLGALFVNALLLQFAIHGLTLVASAFGREAGRVALVGVLVAVLSFLVNAVAMLWPKASFAKPYSLHGYFEPRDVLVDGNLAPLAVAVLAAVALLGIAGAYLRFVRRDLP